MMTQFLLKMRAIFNFSFLILCAVLSQEMVVAFDDNLELSSVPHNRQKRMLAPRGTAHVTDLPPLLAYNLRGTHMTEPSRFWVTRNGDPVGLGYAIHPYLVLTLRRFIGDGHNYGVSWYEQFRRIYVPERVARVHPDPDDQFVVILLKDPLVLNEREPGAFANYPISVTNWAEHVAEEWIRTELPKLHTLLAQNLHELHFDHPTAVQITSYGARTGPGYAIHPYIVITRPAFISGKCGVAVRMGITGELSPHRKQTYFENYAEEVAVILLLDPILLTQDASVAFSEAHYSHAAIAWVRAVAENWKYNMLNNQANCYHENSV